MNRRMTAILIAVVLMITMTGTFSVFAGEYDNDNTVVIDQGLSLVINDVRIGYNPWVGKYNIGTAKKFTTTIWVGKTRYENVRCELKIYGTGTISNFKFNNNGKWVSIKEYNSQMIPKLLDENGKKREFQVTFNKAGRYIIEFNLYDSTNKLLDSNKCDLDVTEQGISEHVKGNFPEVPTESPETITKEQQKPTTQAATEPQSVKVANTKVKTATKKKKSKKAKISLKKVKSATGYQIKISTTKAFKKVLVKKKVTKYKFTISSKKIKNKKKLYIKARAYITVNKKTHCGSWTKAKRIKIK